MQKNVLVTEKRYIAVDLGADSGRVMLGVVSADLPPKAGNLRLEEVHRFSNGPIERDGALHWDFDRLMSETKTGISKAAKQAKGKVAGIGVDSWGVDFGLLDENGNLTENPYHYRDKRTNGIMDKAFELMPKREIYEQTGIQFMQLNSVYQLLSMRLSESAVLKKAKRSEAKRSPRRWAKHLIFMADLVSYFLSGKLYAEYTLASTSQLMDMRTGKWSRPVFDKLNLPIEIMPDVSQPATIIGPLTKEVSEQIGSPPIPLIAVASHDSASAVAAIPAEQNSNWAYISSGTWSVMGAQTPGPIINDKTFAHQFTNEGGVEGTIRLLKNIMGLWLVQECKRQWQKEGQDLSYAQLTEMAQNAKPFAATVDVNSSAFLAPGDMPKRINEHLVQTGQQQIKDKGQMVRVLLECLALKYRQTMEQLEEVTGSSFDRLHIVGGGSLNELLNQFTANATGRTVIAGPVEAAAIGNILMQAMATGQIKSVVQGKQLVRNSFPLKQYQPTETALWQQRYNKTNS